MGLSHSPQIVTDGLVLCLDAANNKSYSGSGTTWIDRSGNGNNGTLTSGASFSSSEKSMAFDGTDDIVDMGDLGSLYTNGTIIFWMKSTAVENYRNPVSTKLNGSNIAIRFEQYSSVSPYGGFNVIIGSGTSTYLSHDYSPSSILDENVWYNVVLVWDTSANNVKGYLNGDLKFNESHTLWPSTMPQVVLGNGFSASRYFSGYIPIFNLYNKSLTEDEVLQNFNATRSRFGL